MAAKHRQARDANNGVTLLFKKKNLLHNTSDFILPEYLSIVFHTIATFPGLLVTETEENKQNCEHNKP